MSVFLWLLLLGGASERIAVIVNDPAGHAGPLAEMVAHRLRAEGVSAQAVVAPRELASLAEQETAARRVGATRIVSIDIAVRRDQRVGATSIEPYRWPEARVWRFSLQPVVGASGWEAGAAPPEPPRNPPAAARPEERVVEELRADTHVVSRRVGQARPDIDVRLGEGGFATWRRDLALREGHEALEPQERLRGVIERDIAEQTAELVLR